MNKYPVWLDCDVGVDDAIALLALHALPQLELLGISTVCGNASQANTSRNALRMNGLMKTAYPVHRGAETPLFRELHTSVTFHGHDGLGGAALPVPVGAAFSDIPAWDAIYAAAQAHPGQLQLIAIGPLTNVAISLAQHPDLTELVGRILLMGGAATSGNVTPAAEFNIYDDPEAAKLVFESGIPIVMCGLDVTMKAYLTPDDWDELAATGTQVGRFVRDILQTPWRFVQTKGMPGVAMHDSCPVLYLAHPELFRGEDAGVAVETKGTVTLGKTVTDLYSDKQFEKKNAFVVLDVDRDRFVQILKDCIKSY